MTKKTKVSLQPTEGLVFQVAGAIYSAYLSGGKVREGEEHGWMERAVREAVQLAQLTESRVQSDNELD